MTDQEIKEMFSKKILCLKDKGTESCLRKILYGTKNKIDWQEAYKIAIANMPELEKYKPGID